MNNTIVLKGIIDEDFVNYGVPSMTLMFPKCTFKCDKEAGNGVCQNGDLLRRDDIIIPVKYLCERYLNNEITHAVVCQGLEPLDSFSELELLIDTLRSRYGCMDDVVIYTGYNKDEVTEKIDILSDYKNIIFKFGRFVPGQKKHFDKILGVSLASDNQYAERVGDYESGV